VSWEVTAADAASSIALGDLALNGQPPDPAQPLTRR